MKEKIKLSIGLFDKDTKKQEVDTYTAVDLIEKAVMATGVGGLSVYTGNGVYLHDDGTLVKEPSVFVEVYGWKLDSMKTAVQFIKRELNQESISVEITQCQVEFM